MDSESAVSFAIHSQQVTTCCLPALCFQR